MKLSFANSTYFALYALLAALTTTTALASDAPTAASTLTLTPVSAGAPSMSLPSPTPTMSMASVAADVSAAPTVAPTVAPSLRGSVQPQVLAAVSATTAPSIATASVTSGHPDATGAASVAAVVTPPSATQRPATSVVPPPTSPTNTNDANKMERGAQITNTILNGLGGLAGAGLNAASPFGKASTENTGILGSVVAGIKDITNAGMAAAALAKSDKSSNANQ